MSLFILTLKPTKIVNLGDTASEVGHGYNKRGRGIGGQNTNYENGGYLSDGNNNNNNTSNRYNNRRGYRSNNNYNNLNEQQKQPPILHQQPHKQNKGTKFNN